MSRIRWSSILFLMIAVLIIGLGACAPEEADDPDPDIEPEEPTEVRVAYGADATNLDPRLATDVSSGLVNDLFYDGLVMWDEELNVQPLVAEDYELTEEVFTFYLREGVKFHDGKELTAEDVKYTFDTIRDPDFEARNLPLYEPVAEIEIVDDYTVKFHLSEPNAPLIYYLHVGIIPKHIAEEEGDEYLQTNPVGAGPFEFVEWSPNDYIELKANDDYWDGRPHIDKIMFKPIPEDVTRRVELETGGVHIAFPVPPEDVERMQEDPDVDLQEQPGSGFEYISFDHTQPPFDDVRVRQAIAYAIDREEIIDHVYWGLRDVAYSPIIPQSWGHNPDVHKFEFNPEKARELLEEAGYEDGFEIDLKISESDPRREISEILQYELDDFGIDITITEQEWGAFYDDILNMDFDMYILGWGAQTDPDRGLYRQFHSDNFPPEGANRQRYSNERVDELLDLARTTMDVEQRKQYYYEIQEILAEDQSYVYLNYTVDFCAVNPELEDFEYQTYFRLFQLKDARLTE